jgi:hypothetical protein
MLRRVLSFTFIVVFSLAAVLPVLAAAPAEGIAVEGVSVPGVSLGDSREQVDVAYGQPDSCQGPESSFCGYPVEEGGQVFIHYQGADGGPAAGLPGDTAYSISWYNTAWTTTAGVSTGLALEDPQAVIDAYPNARVTTNQWGAIVRVEDAPLGVAVNWHHDFYGQFTTVNIQIFFPREPAPLPEQITRVVDIDLQASKSKGRRTITALPLVRNEQELAAAGATVFATWIGPDGTRQAVEDVTSSSGYAYFELPKARRGTYTLVIEDVVLDGYRFDAQNSVLSATISVK